MMQDQPTTASRAAENTPAATTGTTKETLPSTTKAGPGAVTGAGTGATTGAPKAGGHTGGILDSVKQAMGGAPWQVDISKHSAAKMVKLSIFWALYGASQHEQCMLQRRVGFLWVRHT